MKSLSILSVFVVSLFLSLSALAEPSWDTIGVPNGVAEISVMKWAEKDDGLLFTCILNVKNDNLVKPLSHLRLVGLDSAGNEVWSEYKSIRRRNFDDNSAVAGFRSHQRVRIFIKDNPIPDSLTVVNAEFVNESPSSKGY